MQMGQFQFLPARAHVGLNTCSPQPHILPLILKVLLFFFQKSIPFVDNAHVVYDPVEAYQTSIRQDAQI